MSGPGSACYGGKATSSDWGKINNTLTTVISKSSHCFGVLKQ